jgi:hypothetical protein
MLLPRGDATALEPKEVCHRGVAAGLTAEAPTPAA